MWQNILTLYKRSCNVFIEQAPGNTILWNGTLCNRKQILKQPKVPKTFNCSFGWLFTVLSAQLAWYQNILYTMLCQQHTYLQPCTKSPIYGNMWMYVWACTACTVIVQKDRTRIFIWWSSSTIGDLVRVILATCEYNINRLNYNAWLQFWN